MTLGDMRSEFFKPFHEEAPKDSGMGPKGLEDNEKPVSEYEQLKQKAKIDNEEGKAAKEKLVKIAEEVKVFHKQVDLDVKAALGSLNEHLKENPSSRRDAIKSVIDKVPVLKTAAAEKAGGDPMEIKPTSLQQDFLKDEISKLAEREYYEGLIKIVNQEKPSVDNENQKKGYAQMYSANLPLSVGGEVFGYVGPKPEAIHNSEISVGKIVMAAFEHPEELVSRAVPILLGITSAAGAVGEAIEEEREKNKEEREAASGKHEKNKKSERFQDMSFERLDEAISDEVERILDLGQDQPERSKKLKAMLYEREQRRKEAEERIQIDILKKSEMKNAIIEQLKMFDSSDFDTGLPVWAKKVELDMRSTNAYDTPRYRGLVEAILIDEIDKVKTQLFDKKDFRDLNGLTEDELTYEKKRVNLQRNPVVHIGVPSIYLKKNTEYGDGGVSNLKKDKIKRSEEISEPASPQEYEDEEEVLGVEAVRNRPTGEAEKAMKERAVNSYIEKMKKEGGTPMFDERFTKRFDLPSSFMRYEFGLGWHAIPTLQVINELATVGQTDYEGDFYKSREFKALDRNFKFFFRYGAMPFVKMCSDGTRNIEGILETMKSNGTREDFFAKFLQLNLEGNVVAKKDLEAFYVLGGYQVKNVDGGMNKFVNENASYVIEGMDEKRAKKLNEESSSEAKYVFDKSKKHWMISGTRKDIFRSLTRSTKSQELQASKTVLELICVDMSRNKDFNTDYGTARWMMEYYMLFGEPGINYDQGRMVNFYEKYADPRKWKDHFNRNEFGNKEKALLKSFADSGRLMGDGLGSFLGYVDPETGKAVSDETLMKMGILQNGIKDASGRSLAEGLSTKGIDGFLEVAGNLGASKVGSAWSGRKVILEAYDEWKSKFFREDREHYRASTQDLFYGVEKKFTDALRKKPPFTLISEETMFQMLRTPMAQMRDDALMNKLQREHRDEIRRENERVKQWNARQRMIAPITGTVDFWKAALANLVPWFLKRK